MTAFNHFYFILCFYYLIFLVLLYKMKAPSNPLNWFYKSNVSVLGDSTSHLNSNHITFSDSSENSEKFEDSKYKKKKDIVKLVFNNVYFPWKSFSNFHRYQIVYPFSAIQFLASYRPIRHMELPNSTYFTTLSANGFFYPGTGASVTCIGCDNSVQLTSFKSKSPSNATFHKPGCGRASNESSDSAASPNETYGRSSDAQLLDPTANNNEMSNLRRHTSDSGTQEHLPEDDVHTLREGPDRLRSYEILAVAASTHVEKEECRRNESSSHRNSTAENSASTDVDQDISAEVSPHGAEEVFPLGAEGGLHLCPTNEENLFDFITDEINPVQRLDSINSSCNNVSFTKRRERRVVMDTSNDLSSQDLEIETLASQNNLPPLENFSEPNARMRTFDRCRHLLPWASRLAERGFFLTGRGNILICFICKEKWCIESSEDAAAVYANHRCSNSDCRNRSRSKNKKRKQK